MFTNVLYIASFIVLFIAILKFKKYNSNANIGLWIIITYFIVWIINSLIIFAFSIFNFPAYIFIRSVIFILFSLVLFFVEKKFNYVQRYEKINVPNFLMIILLIIITVVICYLRFGNGNLIFETTDPAAHFLSAERFSNSNKLLEMSEPDRIYGGNKTDRSMFFSYTYMGTLFQISHNFGNSKIIDIKIFEVFEVLVMIFTSLLAFYFLKEKIKFKNDSIFNEFLTILLIFLMIIGYPLNNMIFGYHYLGLFILVALIIINLFLDYENKDNFNNKSFLFISGIFFFSVFLTYYLFVPVVFGSAGIYYLYKYKFKRTYKFKQIFKIALFSIFIPFLIGIFYYFVLNKILYSDSVSSAISPFSAEGYIYRNLIGNFVFLLLIFFYNIINDIKNKNVTFLDFLIFSNLLYILFLLFFLYNGQSASYYFYKNYYLLWVLLYLSLGANLLSKDNSIYGFARSILFTILFVLIIFNFNIENKLTNKNILINPTQFSPGLTDIYFFNKDRMNLNNHPYIYTDNELKQLDLLYKDYIKDIKQSKFYYYTSDLFKRLWIYDLFDLTYTPNFDSLGSFYISLPEFNVIADDDSIKFLLVDKKSDNNFDVKNFKILSETENFILYNK